MSSTHATFSLLKSESTSVLTQEQKKQIKSHLISLLKYNMQIPKERLREKASHEANSLTKLFLSYEKDQQLKLEINQIVDEVVLQKPQLEAEAKAREEAALTTPIQMFIKTLTGKTIVIDCILLDTIQTIKERIADKEGIPVEAQRILIGGKSCEDDKTLNAYNICRHETAHLVTRLNHSLSSSASTLVSSMSSSSMVSSFSLSTISSSSTLIKTPWDSIPIPAKATISEKTHGIRKSMPNTPTVRKYWDEILTPEEQSQILKAISEEKSNLTHSDAGPTYSRCIIS